MKISITNILTNIVYYYMMLTTLIMNFIRKIKSQILRVNGIILINNNKKYDIYVKYVLLSFFIKIRNLIDSTRYFIYVKNIFVNWMNKIINMSDENCELIDINVFNQSNERRIILENVKLTNVIDKINNVEFDVNELVIPRKCIITELSIVSENGKNKKSIKKMLERYADKSKKYSNNIKNIFLVNGINTNEIEHIEIEYVKIMSGPKKLQIPVNKFIENHISDIYTI